MNFEILYVVIAMTQTTIYRFKIQIKFMIYMENRIDVPTTDILQNMVQSYQANCDLSYHISVRCHGKCLVEIPCGSALCTIPTKRYISTRKDNDILVYVTHLREFSHLIHLSCIKVQEGGEIWRY